MLGVVGPVRAQPTVHRRRRHRDQQRRRRTGNDQLLEAPQPRHQLRHDRGEALARRGTQHRSAKRQRHHHIRPIPRRPRGAGPGASDTVTDVAVLQADRKGLPAAVFDTTLPPVGALAVVLGSPLGFENTVTAGIISGVHRDLPGSASTGTALVDLMQTDAPISPGNSGGAVIDGQGKVVGMSEAYIPPSAGAVAIGFASGATSASSTLTPTWCAPWAC